MGPAGEDLTGGGAFNGTGQVNHGMMTVRIGPKGEDLTGGGAFRGTE